MLPPIQEKPINEQPFFRFLKVIYIFLILVTVGVSMFFLIKYYNEQSMKMDSGASMIVCRYGNNKIYNLKSLNIDLSKQDLDDFGKWPEIMEEQLGILSLTYPGEYITKERFMELSQKNSLIEDKCDITLELKTNLMLQAWSNNSQKTFDFNQRYWDIKPVYSTGRAMLKTGIMFCVVSILSILMFVGIKWLFDYIFFGNSQLNEFQKQIIENNKDK